MVTLLRRVLTLLRDGYASGVRPDTGGLRGRTPGLSDQGPGHDAIGLAGPPEEVAADRRSRARVLLGGVGAYIQMLAWCLAISWSARKEAVNEFAASARRSSSFKPNSAAAAS